MGQNQQNQDWHNLEKYTHAQFLPKKWQICYWLFPGTTSDVLWRIGILWSALTTEREGGSECGEVFFPSGQVSMVGRRTYSSVERSGNQEYKEKDV